MLPNDVRLRINVIDQLDTDFFMAKSKGISYVSNTIKTLHIQKNMHLIYKQDFYKDKQKEIVEIFIRYLVLIMGDHDHPELIEEWVGGDDAVAYESNLNQYVKITSIFS